MSRTIKLDTLRRLLLLTLMVGIAPLISMELACAPAKKVIKTPSKPKIDRSTPPAFVPPSSPALVAARAERAARRAYVGAPPPMPADHDRDATCDDCHDGGDAPTPPHRALTACKQCHVYSKPAPGIAAATAFSNQFKSAGPAGRGPRAFKGAPPVIPHRVQMRSRCLTCHGKEANKALRTSHPQRRNCRQCHVAR